jgi:hypothetical protein
MSRALRLATVGALAIVLAAPAGALAQRHIVQPGDPGSAQYQEDIPTAAGGRPVTSIHPTTATQTTVTLPPAAVHALAKAGASGHSTIALAQATAPPPSATRSVSPGSKPQSSPPHAISYRAAGTAGVLIGSLLGSGGGMGVFLPILLGLLLGLAIALALARRRT